MTKRTTSKPGGSQDTAFITNEGVSERHVCSVESVKRAAKREGWTVFRMGGRVVRYLLAEVEAYEKRCARAAPSYRITPPKRHANP